MNEPSSLQRLKTKCERLTDFLFKHKFICIYLLFLLYFIEFMPFSLLAEALRLNYLSRRIQLGAPPQTQQQQLSEQ